MEEDKEIYMNIRVLCFISSGKILNLYKLFGDG